jgi:hypothetical protein
MSALALQACALLLPVPHQKILRSGLNLEDEFDRVFLMGGGCPPDSLQKTLKVKMTRVLCDRAADEFVKVVRKHREMGVPPKTYLLSKGGTCTETAKRQWYCVVERVVTTTYCGPSSDLFYDLFSSDCVKPGSSVSRYVLKVETRDPGGDIRADFECF